MHETASVPTPEANRSVPPPPQPPTIINTTSGNYGAGGGFLRSFGLGAGACIGMVVAVMLLFTGCAVIAALAGGGG